MGARLCQELLKERLVNSINALFSNNKISNVALVCNDKNYKDWILSLLAEQHIPIATFDGDDIDEIKVKEILNLPNTYLLNATWAPLKLSGEFLREFGGKVIDCIQGTKVPGDYGLWVYDADNRPVITKAFLPIKEAARRIFPFPKNNDVVRVSAN